MPGNYQTALQAREMGAWTFSGLGWMAIQLCLLASALTTQMKLTKGFGYLLWPLLRVVQFSKLKWLASKDMKKLLPQAEMQAWLLHWFNCMLWEVMAISKSSHEFGIRNLLLTSFEQLRSFIYGTATLLPQKCNHDLFPCYLSAKAPGGICVTLRTHGDPRMHSWGLQLFSEKKTSKMIFAVPLGWWLACHQAIRVSLRYFHVLK